MNVNFYLRKDNQKSVKGYIQVSFSWNGIRWQISTKESILVKYWNTKRKPDGLFVLKGEHNWTHVNKRLSDIKKWAGDIFYDYLQNDKDLSRDEFIKLYNDKFTKEQPEETGSTIIDHLNEIAKHKSLVNRHKTGLYYKTTCKHFTDFATENGFEQLTLAYLDNDLCQKFVKYLVSQGKKNITVNNYARMFKIMLNEMVSNGTIKNNPFKYKEFEIEEGKNVAYTDDQLKIILPELRRELFNYVKFIYYTFARPNEVRQIKVSHINLKEKTIFIPSEVSKNKISRTVEILEPLSKVIQSMNIEGLEGHLYVFGLKPEPHHKNHFNTEYRKVLNDLKFPKEYTAYSFKHTGVIKHFLAGFDLRWLQDQTGHKDIANLMKYLRSLGLKVNRANNIQAPEI